VKNKILVNKVIEKAQYDPKKVEEIINLALDGIADIIIAEGQIELSDFGEFEIVTAKPRKVRNFKTGEKHIMPEHQKVRFKASKVMKERVNDHWLKPVACHSNFW